MNLILFGFYWYSSEEEEEEEEAQEEGIIGIKKKAYKTKSRDDVVFLLLSL